MTVQINKTVAGDLIKVISNAVPLLLAISDSDASIKPAPAKWSKKEILGHLIDSASNNHHKIVRLMGTNDLSFPGYEQDFWVEVQNYNERNWNDLIELWAALNKHLAFIISVISDASLNNMITIDSNDPVPLSFVIKDYVRHLRYHLVQMGIEV